MNARPCLTISVDDGHPLDLRVAALLERHDLRATFYLPMSNDEGPPVIQAEQMRALAQHFEIGSHTRSHRFLATLDDAAARAQIVDGKRMLEDCLGQPVHGFCYPGGHYRRRHIAMVRDAGFRYARTTQNLRIDAGRRPFEMPTTLQFYPHPRSVLARNLLSRGDRLARLPGLMTAMSASDWLERVHRLLLLAAERNGVFHLWLHSLDIDRLDLWQSLSRFLARAAACMPPQARATNGELAGDMFSRAPDAPPPAATADSRPGRPQTRDAAR